MSRVEPSDGLYHDVVPIADRPCVGCGGRDRRRLRVAVLAVLWTLAAFAGGWAATAQAQAPAVVYDENFENGVGTTPVILTGYTGATGQAYTAAPAWLTACNGAVLQFNSPDSAQVASGCGTLGNYSRVRQLAYALGVQGGVTPATNHAVTAFTENDPGPNNVEFQTVGEVPLPTSSRFLTFQVDAAAVNCAVSAPLYQFSLTSGATSTPVGGVINACTSLISVSVPAVGNVGAIAARVGTYTSNGSVLFTGSSVGIRMVNANGSGTGNDAAFDNIRILDATPRLGKSFSPAALNAGGTSTLTFTITNTSERAAKNGWSLTDTLPAGLVVTSPANASTTCSGGQVTAAAGGGSIAVTGNLAAGQASCTASVNVTASTPGTYTNGPANVTTTGLEPPPPSTVQFLSADVAIVKSASPGTITPGTNVTYTLAVTNHGPDPAVNMRVSDPLPSGLMFVSASPECSAAGADVTCAVGSLAAGASQTFTVTASVASSVTGRVTNTAMVTSDTPDPNPGNNTSTTTVPSEGVADLSISKSASTSTVRPNGQVLYTLVIENHGPSDATGVTVTDTPPAGLVPQSANPAQGTCEIIAGRVSCSLGALAAGGSTQVLVTAQTTADASGSLTNTATVSGDQADPDPSDNTSTATVAVPSPPIPAQARADLSITKRAGRTRVALGQALTYTIVVTNNGPSPATDVNVTDTTSLPGRLLSARPSAGTCERTLPLTCALGTIVPDRGVTITVRFRPTDTGALRNAASVTSENADPETTDNLAVVATRVRPALAVTKVANRRTISAGQMVTYRIRVRNPSQQAVRNVRTCDRLPSGLAFVTSTPRARPTRGQYCWTAKRLGAGRSRTYKLTAGALSGTSATKVNRATATSPDAATGRARRSVRIIGSACSPASAADRDRNPAGDSRRGFLQEPRLDLRLIERLHAEKVVERLPDDPGGVRDSATAGTLSRPLDKIPVELHRRGAARDRLTRRDGATRAIRSCGWTERLRQVANVLEQAAAAPA
jgi:uncharacterized repeat protein (TIGR01451 family)